MQEHIARVSKRLSAVVVVLGLGALIAAAFPAVPASASGIYWTNFNGTSLGKANLDGSGTATVPVANPFPVDVATDGTYLYWTTSRSTSIGRATLDGSQVDPNFITGVDSSAVGIATDGTYLYWANPSFNTVGRAKLDGTGVDESFITLSSNVNEPVALAVNGSSIFWSSLGGNGDFSRANLDGSGIDSAFLSGYAAFFMAADANYIYWVDYTTSDIGRANLDGSNADPTFISGVGAIGVAVDAGHIYWTANGSIGRANLDGTGVDPNFITSATAGAFGITVLPEPGAGLLLAVGALGLAMIRRRSGSRPQPLSA